MAEAFPGVRTAGPRDEIPLFETLKRMWEENALASLDEDKVMAMIQRGTRRELGIIGIIDGQKREIAATAGFTLDQWWYTSDWHLDEKWVFVTPEHRKSDYAKRLYQYGKWLGDQMDHMPVIFGVLSTKRTKEKLRLAQRQLQQVGGLFLHNHVVPDAYQQREFITPKKELIGV